MRDELYERELGWMELVARAFPLFFKNIKAIFFVLVAVFLPISLLEGVIVMRVTAAGSFLNTVQTAGAILQNRVGVSQALSQTFFGSVLDLAMAVFLVPVGVIAIAKIVKQSIDGEEPDAKAAVGEALALEPTIIAAGIKYGFLVFLGCIALIIPGIWISILWGLYEYCIGLAGKEGWDEPLSHSAELVRGRWWRTWGYGFVLGCIVTLFNLVFEGVYAVCGVSYITVVLCQFGMYFTNAFSIVGLALLFINREAEYLGWQYFGGKKEADLEIMG